MENTMKHEGLKMATKLRDKNSVLCLRMMGNFPIQPIPAVDGEIPPRDTYTNGGKFPPRDTYARGRKFQGITKMRQRMSKLHGIITISTLVGDSVIGLNRRLLQ